jgi:hypothetical protein
MSESRSATSNICKFGSTMIYDFNFSKHPTTLLLLYSEYKPTPTSTFLLQCNSIKPRGFFSIPRKPYNFVFCDCSNKQWQEQEREDSGVYTISVAIEWEREQVGVGTNERTSCRTFIWSVTVGNSAPKAEEFMSSQCRCTVVICNLRSSHAALS